MQLGLYLRKLIPSGVQSLRIPDGHQLATQPFLLIVRTLHVVTVALATGSEGCNGFSSIWPDL
jgi:hypothetical protein